MSYTIEELDEAIQDEANDWSGDWHEFQEATDRTYLYLRDESGDYIRGDDNRLVKQDLDTPGANLPGLGQATLVDDFGGEGQGDEYWFIFKVTNAEGYRLFRRNGWYASFDGGYYEGPTEEVQTVEKTITVYEAI